MHHGKSPIILMLKAAKLRDGSSSSVQALTFRFDHKSTDSFLQKPNLPTSCNSTQNLTVFVLFTVIFALLYSELHSFCTRTIIYMDIVVILQALSTIIITREKKSALFISVQNNQVTKHVSVWTVGETRQESLQTPCRNTEEAQPISRLKLEDA